LAAALLAAGVAVSASSTNAQGECAAETLKGKRGTWTVLPGPKFPSGAPVISAHTIDRRDPDVHFATNGTVVMRSTDAACSWEEVYRLPDAPTPAMPVDSETGRIERLEAARGVVIVPVSAPGTALPDAPTVGKLDVATVIVRSDDGGDNWDTATAPLPGSPGPVAFGDDEPTVVWAAAGTAIYGSTDDGEVFAPVTPPPGAASRIESLVASAFDVSGGDMLLAKAADGPAFLSVDDGTTWKRYEQADVGTDGPVIQPVAKGHESRIAFFDTEPKTGALTDFVYSTDQGASFKRFGAKAVEGLDGTVTSFEGEQRRGDIVLTTTEGVYRFHPRAKRMVSVDEFALAPLRGAQAPHIWEDLVTYRFHNDSEIVVYQEAPGGAAALPLPGVEDFTNAGPPPAVLEPAGGDVPVPPGSTKTMKYSLSLAARSTQLDTFFVLDTSNSTDPYIRGLQVGITKIARGLASAGVETRFGLGEYQDTGQENPRTKAVRYARRAAIGGADALRSALSKVVVEGGQEPGYTALHQALTGTGVPKPANGLPVAPGQQAGWRPKAVRTVVLVADESFAADPDGADRAAALDALRADDIGFVGVIVRDRKFDTAEPGVDCAAVLAAPDKSYDGTEGDHRLRCQLEDLAAAAGTFAPATGTDCDGDGQIDVAPGKPLVCTIPPEGSEGIVAVADPLRRLLLAVTEEQPVKLNAGEGTAVREVKPGGDFARLDLKKAHALEFEVSFSCTSEQAGQRLPVKLEALVAGRALAEAAPTVLCGAVPAAVAAKPRPKKKPAAREPATKPNPAPEAQPQAAPAPPPPVPAPAAPAPAPVPAVVSPPATVPPPAPASAPAPAPASAPAPSVAIAAKREAATSPTLVHVHEDEGQTSELQFSAAQVGGATAVLAGALFLLPGGLRRKPPAVPAFVHDRTEAPRRRRRRSR
jgi:hypothetical protein